MREKNETLIEYEGKRYSAKKMYSEVYGEVYSVRLSDMEDDDTEVSYETAVSVVKILLFGRNFP